MSSCSEIFKAASRAVLEAENEKDITGYDKLNEFIGKHTFLFRYSLSNNLGMFGFNGDKLIDREIQLGKDRENIEQLSNHTFSKFMDLQSAFSIASADGLSKPEMEAAIRKISLDNPEFLINQQELGFAKEALGALGIDESEINLMGMGYIINQTLVTEKELQSNVVLETTPTVENQTTFHK